MPAVERCPAVVLSRDAGSTLAEQLALRFAQQIEQRLLPPGARLPSVRDCARRHGVSAYTVVAAYERLQARGLVDARRQRGFFVREPAAAGASRRSGGTTAAGKAADRGTAPGAAAAPLLPVSATTLMRGLFQAPGGKPAPGLGTLPAEWLDLPMLAAALRRLANGAGLAALTLQYGDPAGDLRLRRALAGRLAEHGIAAGAEHIVTTVGATHALDVVTRTLLRPGDSVLVDEPGWSVEFARLGALGLRVLPVPRGEDGPDLAVMQRLIDAQRPAERPRLYVTVSVLHNPTGASLSLGAAHRLLTLAQAHDLHIVEDDSYAYLAPAHLPRLAALDALRRTIYVGGFSKILAPALRVGYIAAPAAWVDRLVDTKMLTTLSTPALTEQVLAHCLELGLLRRHAERVVQKLAAARARSVRLAEAHGCRFAAPPRGLFGWLHVARGDGTGIDTERLARAVFDDGWLLAPGALFYATPRATSLMRINFASTQHLRFWRALDAARQLL